MCNRESIGDLQRFQRQLEQLDEWEEIMRTNLDRYQTKVLNKIDAEIIKFVEQIDNSNPEKAKLEASKIAIKDAYCREHLRQQVEIMNQLILDVISDPINRQANKQRVLDELQKMRKPLLISNCGKL